MASIKKLTDRKFKITISNGYRPNGKKICKAKTITVPDSVKPRGIRQYIAHEAEELERLVKSGFAEDRDTTFETYAARWLERQVKYAPGTLASYRRMLERVYPYIGAIKLGELRPMALENMLIELRKRTHQGKPIQEATVQKYLTVVSAILSDAKRNEIISKNPARMIDLPDTEHRQQFIPTDEQAQYFLNALSEEHILYHAFYVLAIYTGCRRGGAVHLAVERLLLCGPLHLESRSLPLPQCGAGERRGGGAHQKWPQPFHDHLLLRSQHTVEPLRLPEAHGQGEPSEGQPLSVRQRPGKSGSPGHLHQAPAETLPRAGVSLFFSSAYVTPLLCLHYAP